MKIKNFKPLEALKKTQERISKSSYSYLAFSFILPATIMYLVYVAI